MFGGFDNSTNICDMMPTVEWSHQHVTDDDLIEPMGLVGGFVRNLVKDLEINRLDHNHYR